MITPDYPLAMGAYNAEMNRRLYEAAGRLSDADRRVSHGAFWDSIHGTFNHLLWADRMWMSRFDGWERPVLVLKESHTLIESWKELDAARTTADQRIITWAQGLTPDWLQADQTWFSGAVQREVRRPRTLLLAHMFNHQTHHRGQIHAMLTAAGQETGDTDLWAIAG